MFLALRKQDQSRVTSISSVWNGREEELSSMARAGELICPGCGQSLWVRVGEKRRRHFAHRHLADCHLDKDSPEVLETKAQLFEWLEARFPGNTYLDRAVDPPYISTIAHLLVETSSERTFVYWIFDRQQRQRDIFLDCQRLEGVSVHFIHTHSALKQPSDEQIALSASQRAFCSRGKFDGGESSRNGGHLHFFNSENSSLLIFRGLHCVHAPNLFGWGLLRNGPLNLAAVCDDSGELVFDADLSELESRKSRTPEGSPPDIDYFLKKPSWMTRTYRCTKCGIITNNWSQSHPAKGTCVCRQCMA